MIFNEPVILFIIPVFLIIFAVMRRKVGGGAFIFPAGEIISYPGSRLKLRLAMSLPFFRAASVVMIIIALAGPEVMKSDPIKKVGIAVVLAIDCSSSMLAEDLGMDFRSMARKDVPKGAKNLRRIDGVKIVAKDFIDKRSDDLIGVVAFAAEAFVVCPPTFHYDWTRQAVDRVDVGLIKDATAVGSGVMASLNTLKEVEARSRIVVLLTDGINNFGTIPPLVAARVARTLGIKIYTIGLVGARERFTEADDGSGRKIFKGNSIDVDEGELKAISAMTGGQYFRAEDFASLNASYSQIDRLEKTVMEKGEYQDREQIFGYFVYAALFFLLFELVLANTFLKKIP